MSLDAAEMKMLGASDMPALLGLSPWSGPVALWARIVHGWAPATTADMHAGNAAEEYNRALYRQATGYTLAGPSKWRHPLYSWLRCSPDDTATDTPDGRRGVELKRYNNLEGWGAPGSDAVPQDIWVQVQFQGGVALELGHWDTGRVDVSGLLRGEHRLYVVPHVPEVYGRCVEVAERFWRDFVLPQRCPEGDNLVLLERDAQAVRDLFTAPDRTRPLTGMVWDALTDAERGVVARWLEANDARAAWEKREKGLKAQVQHLLRDVPGLLLPEGMSARRVDFREQSGRPNLDVKALREALKDEDPAFARRMEELLRQCTKQENTRPLVAR
jgi:hypothetical protein